MEELCRLYADCSPDDLTPEEMTDLDQNIFTCDQCNWTLPIDDQGESEEADGFLCKECEGESAEDD